MTLGWAGHVFQVYLSMLSSLLILHRKDSASLVELLGYQIRNYLG